MKVNNAKVPPSGIVEIPGGYALRIFLVGAVAGPPNLPFDKGNVGPSSMVLLDPTGRYVPGITIQDPGTHFLDPLVPKWQVVVFNANGAPIDDSPTLVWIVYDSKDEVDAEHPLPAADKFQNTLTSEMKRWRLLLDTGTLLAGSFPYTSPMFDTSDCRELIVYQENTDGTMTGVNLCSVSPSNKIKTIATAAPAAGVVGELLATGAGAITTNGVSCFPGPVGPLCQLTAQLGTATTGRWTIIGR